MQNHYARWRHKKQIFAANKLPMVDWLDNKSSMLKRLAKLTSKKIHVKVQKQSMRLPMRDEAKSLKIKSRRYALIREVMISTPENQLIIGRSVFPKEFLRGKSKKLIFNSKRKALGQLLFKDPSLQRQDFEFVLKTFNLNFVENNKLMWSRRGKIFIKAKPFLLTEIILPELHQILNSN